MPELGFEPRCLAALPPQDSVSTNFTIRAACKAVFDASALALSNLESVSCRRLAFDLSASRSAEQASFEQALWRELCSVERDSPAHHPEWTEPDSYQSDLELLAV